MLAAGEAAGPAAGEGEQGPVVSDRLALLAGAAERSGSPAHCSPVVAVVGGAVRAAGATGSLGGGRAGFKFKLTLLSHCRLNGVFD